LDKIIVNYWQLSSEKKSRLRREEEPSLYKIILCGYLTINNWSFGSSFSPQITQITLILSAGGLAITQIGYAELKVLSWFHRWESCRLLRPSGWAFVKKAEICAICQNFSQHKICVICAICGFYDFRKLS